MEIRVLKYFLTVAREETITKAAEVLHITQPTLSRQLSSLEEETGVQLFKRGIRKITLTNEGFLLRRRAEEIIELVDKTSQELLEQDELVEGTITIGSGELGAMETVARLCGTFREKYPRVRFDIYTATADVVKERIERGATDIGLLLEPIDMEKFEFIRMPEKERWVVLMRADDKLAQCDGITAKQLEKLPLIIPRRLSVQGELANWFGRKFNNLEIAYTCNLTTNIALVVQEGYGYAVVIEGSLPFWDKSKVVAKPLSPALSATTVLAWKRNQPSSHVVKKFIEHSQCLLGIGEAYKLSI